MPKRTSLALVFALAGCSMVHQSPSVRAQDAAMELNLNTRFSRMEMAAEHVAPSARDQFFERRKGWGGALRIADYEFAGLKMKGDSNAEVFVKIAWFRANEGDLRTSTLKQKWRAFGGDWKLVDEERSDGDYGLFGEPEPPAAAPEPRRTHFPTIRLGQGNTD